ncbi:MAG TPA: hypothetical protein VGO98_01980 [Candidatus Saccharimonadales bacterium]|nr:hypothetical protein [Candidatus Saccharimonadales bacterium]
MDYYTVYALLSDDVHSTVYGTSENTIITETGVHVDLEKKGIDSLRNAVTAYSMFLNYINMMTRLYKLNQGGSIRGYRKIEKAQKDRYVALEELPTPSI